jgi:hypothetical protein
MATQTGDRDALTARQVQKKSIPLRRAELHNTAYTANADMLAPDLTPEDTFALFRIYVCLNTAAVFKVVHDDGSTEVDVAMNGGAQLTANAGYMFDVLVDTGDTINFEADQNVTILKMIVEEIAVRSS